MRRLKISKLSVSILFIFAAIASFSIIKTLNNDKKIPPEDLVDISEFPEELMETYFEKYQALEEKWDKKNILIVGSKTRPESYGAVEVVEGPNHQYFLQYATEEAKNEALKNLKNDNNNVYVEENVVHKLSSSDYKSWGIEATGIDHAILETDNRELNTDITVAVIDTGLDTSIFTTSFPGRQYSTYNAVDGTTDVTDNENHGTHVTGTVAEGTPANVKILAIKASSKQDSCEDDKECLVSTDIITAVNYATNNSVDIINMSFGSYDYLDSIKTALDGARSAGIINVAASGNDNTNNPSYPASYDGVISVAAVNPDKTRAVWNLEENKASNFGEYVDFAAPGTDILGINNWIMSGTSMAAPHISASIADLKSLNKNLSYNDIMELLKTTATDLGDEGRDDYYGYGFVDFNNQEFCDGVNSCDEYNIFAIHERTDQTISFTDPGNSNALVENIYKNYGDSNFVIDATITTGDGELNGFSSRNEAIATVNSETGEVSIIGVGDVNICNSTTQTDDYWSTESCYLLHVSPRQIYITGVAFDDKIYDGTTDIMVSNVGFENYVENEYPEYVAVATLDSPNAGERTATTTVELSSGSATIYSLNDNTYDMPVTAFPFNLTDENLVNLPSSMLVGGSIDSSSIELWANGVVLQQNTDYSISISGEDGAVGENVVIEITGQNNYTGTLSRNVPIVAKSIPTTNFDNLGESSVIKTWGDNNFTYTASTSSNGIIFYSSSDSSVATVNSSTGEVEIVGIGTTTITATVQETAEYSEDSISYVLTVNKKELEIIDVGVPDKTFDRTASSEISFVTLSDPTFRLNYEFNAEAAFSDVNVGADKPVTVTVSLSDTTHYNLETNTYVTSATISPLALTTSNTKYSLNATEYAYSGFENHPGLTMSVEINGNSYSLVEGIDYEIEYSSDTINVGTKSARPQGINNYAGYLPELEFSVNPAVLDNINVFIPAQTYAASALTPLTTATTEFNQSQITLNEGSDYTLSYETSIDAGNYIVNLLPVEGGNFTFSDVSGTFVVNPRLITMEDITLEYTRVRYNGEEKHPTVTVTINDTTIDSENYSVSYAENSTDINDSVVVTVQGKNNLSGSAEKNFAIVNKDEITIGINRSEEPVYYTGEVVDLGVSFAIVGTNSLTGESYNIDPANITTEWYTKDPEEKISQPTNIGDYFVVYSYSDDDCEGYTTLDFSILPAVSEEPAEMTENLKIEAGSTLKDLGEMTTGFAWANENTIISAGQATYPATYTYNNDSNYSAININVPVYGLSRINITSTVISDGGGTASSAAGVLEGETTEIHFMPFIGYGIASVTANGIDMTAQISDDNNLIITAGSENISVEVSFRILQYTVSLSGENVVFTPGENFDTNYGSDKIITIEPEFGYRLTSVLVNNVEKLDSLAEGALSLANITENITIVARAKQITYEYLEGEGQTYVIGSRETANFRIDVDYDLFEEDGKVYIDGKPVESSNYTAKSGSTTISFSAAFMNGLERGSHTLAVVFGDGGRSETTFTLIQNPASTDTPAGSNTGTKENEGDKLGNRTEGSEEGNNGEGNKASDDKNKNGDTKETKINKDDEADEEATDAPNTGSNVDNDKSYAVGVSILVVIIPVIVCLLAKAYSCRR